MRKTKVGQELIEAMKSALAYERGEINLRTHEVEIPEGPSEFDKKTISQIRVKKMGVSQSVMAAYVGVTPAAIQAWELGTKKPSGSARRLLQIMDKSPKEFKILIGASEQLKKPKKMGAF